MSTELSTILKSIENAKKSQETKQHSVEIEEAIPFTEAHVLAPTLLSRISPFKPLSRRQKREMHENVVLYRNQYGYITYTGKTLGIDDQDVFLQLLKMGREALLRRDPVIRLEFGARWFLREIGRSEGGRQVKDLYNSIERMTGAKISVNNKQGKSFSDVIIIGNNIDTDKNGSKFLDDEYVLVKLNPAIADFYYTYGRFTQLNLQQRHALTGDLTKALHLFLSTQRKKGTSNDFECTIFEMAEILNLDKNQGARKLRQSLKIAVKRLISEGFLIFGEVQKETFNVRVSPY